MTIDSEEGFQRLLATANAGIELVETLRMESEESYTRSGVEFLEQALTVLGKKGGYDAGKPPQDPLKLMEAAQQKLKDGQIVETAFKRKLVALKEERDRLELEANAHRKVAYAYSRVSNERP